MLFFTILNSKARIKQEYTLGLGKIQKELALKLTEIESELASARAIFQDTDPSIQQLMQQRDQIQGLLQKRTQSILGAATPQVNPNQVIGYGETYQDLTEQLLAELSAERPTQIEAFISKSVPEQYARLKLDLTTMLKEFAAAGVHQNNSSSGLPASTIWRGRPRAST